MRVRASLSHRSLGRGQGYEESLDLGPSLLLGSPVTLLHATPSHTGSSSALSLFSENSGVPRAAVWLWRWALPVLTGLLPAPGFSSPSSWWKGCALPPISVALGKLFPWL